MNICAECRHFLPPVDCGHPDAKDLVTGIPADARMQRYGQALEGDPPICGLLGEWWEPKTVDTA